jgi:hypothetical protein
LHTSSRQHLPTSSGRHVSQVKPDQKVYVKLTFQPDIIFGVLCTAMTFHIFFTYPETAGRTLEEIDYIFECDLPVWRTSQAKSKFAEDVEAVQRTKSLGEKSSEEVVAKHDKAEQLERA